MKAAPKAKASSRTIDIFTGKTQVEAENEAERIKQGADLSKAGEVNPFSLRNGFWESSWPGAEAFGGHVKRSGGDLEEPERLARAETIEEAADRYRASAFKGQEWATEAFGIRERVDEEFRVSAGEGLTYIERMAGEPGKGARSYSGVFFFGSNALRKLLVTIGKAYLATRGSDALKEAFKAIVGNNQGQ